MAVDVEAYYRTYGPMVLRRCRALLKDEELAHDAMQETFVRILSKADVLTDEAPSSLLYCTATRVCLNRLRSKRRRPEDRREELLLSIASLEEPERASLAGQVLNRLFAREPRSTRTIAVLHLLDGLTLAETAEVVGMSVSGVRKRLRTLRTRLHEMDVEVTV